LIIDQTNYNFKEATLKTLFAVFALLWVSLSIACSSQTGRVESSGSVASRDADNTARNERDRNSEIPTAGDQAQNKQDVEIAANIRKAVVSDDSLSVNAHNVKIIASNGAVTLRGPVKSQQEKAAIEAKAKDVAGVSSVHNMLEIEANP
jgi:hyperosmotically inducible protein